jgi:hypothetical protein
MLSYILVTVGALLWLFPLWCFHAPGARLGNFDQRAWPKGRNLGLAIFDVVRAAVGANFLARGLPGLPTIPGAPSWMPEVWLAVTFGVALGAQAFYWRDEDHVRAPVEFFLGAVLILVHPLVLFIGLPLGVGAALAVRAWSAGFIGAGLGVAGVSLMVEAADWRRGLLLGAMANLPVVLSVMAGRHIGAPRK